MSDDAHTIGLPPSYALIDPILKRWVQAQGLVLMQDSPWGDSRSFYQSIGECFQIVVTAEQDGMVRIGAHLMESSDDNEADFSWKAPISELNRALDLCARSYRGWFKGKAMRPKRD